MKRIQLENITKRYPGTVANQSVSLSVEEGEIHALLGENGAGKSTLMKIIYGVVKPDEGTMTWEGERVVVKGAAHARSLGIGMVFQHFSLFETLTVAENIALSLPKHQVGAMADLKRRIVEVSERYGMKLDPDRYVHTLSIGEQQRVEIVRCLLQDVKLLILDEPTSVLTPQEVDTLFLTLRQLSSEGCSILFISHKLDEVRAICTGATILRGGVVTGACNPQETTADEIARLMVGDDTPLNQDYAKAVGSEIFLQVSNLSHQSNDPFSTSLKNITLDVRKGEILGIAGVAGNGQEELLDMIGGEERAAAQEINYAGQAVGELGPADRRALGLGFVPEERLGRGAVPDMSLEENGLLTAYQGDMVKGGWINHAKVKAFAEKVISDFNVKTPNSLAQAKSLSGGNLQKYIIGREIIQNPKLLVCSHPTWGVDIGAAILIRHELIKLRDAGAAILVVSEDIDELYAISDRICAICDGTLSPVANTSDVTINQLGKWMAGDTSPVNSGAPTANNEERSA